MRTADEAARPLRVFVYGSCVSRDSVEAAPDGRYVVVRYIARQSLISAFTGAAPRPRTSQVTSPFQRRMLEGDADGSLPAQLQHEADRTDLILWDLTDERLGVLRSPDGHIMTRSVDMMSAGLLDDMASWQFIPFGSEEHIQLWATALDEFIALLDRLGLRDRIKLLALPWAERSDDGTPAPASFGTLPASANIEFKRYHALARQRGVATISPPPDEVIAASRHKWGPAPFHYTIGTYKTILSEIDRCPLPPQAGGIADEGALL